LLRLKNPSGGSVEIGVNPRETGYLPQQTAAQKDFPAGAYEIVLSGMLNRHSGLIPFYSRADKAVAIENMNKLNIGYLTRHCYRELSGGQQQRVLLARALCAAQKLLLLDEPVAGLDPLATQELYRQIAMINSETGVTVIMVSHDIGSAVKYAGKILHLKNTQVFFGDTRDYLESEVGTAFMGMGGCNHA
jgi:zinc transport system ATP-binding protein